MPYCDDNWQYQSVTLNSLITFWKVDPKWTLGGSVGGSRREKWCRDHSRAGEERPSLERSQHHKWPCRGSAAAAQAHYPQITPPTDCHQSNVNIKIKFYSQLNFLISSLILWINIFFQFSSENPSALIWPFAPSIDKFFIRALYFTPLAFHTIY